VIGVVFLVGGRSTEHDVSVHSYQSLLAAILCNGAQRDAYVHGVVYIDHLGRWHGFDEPAWPATASELQAGREVGATELATMCRPRDVLAVSLLYGNEGEDGAWQGTAQVLDITGTFGGVLAAALSMDKFMMAAVVNSLLGDRIGTPRTWRIGPGDDVDLSQIVSECAVTGCVIKPNSMGSSILTVRIRHPSMPAVLRAVEAIRPFDPNPLVQEYVRGQEYTCGCILGAGGWRVLPIARVSSEAGFLGHDEKYGTGLIGVDFMDPQSQVGQRLGAASLALCRMLDFFGIVRFDFIVDRAGCLVFLEANYLPGLTTSSIFPAMLRHANLELLDVFTAFDIAWHRRPVRRWTIP
jgi:D-alanine-D-alanine ligase